VLVKHVDQALDRGVKFSVTKLPSFGFGKEKQFVGSRAYSLFEQFAQILG